MKKKLKAKQKKSPRKEKKWEMEDFVASVDAVMQQQEKESPEIRHLHAQLSPEWKIISSKIALLLETKEEEALVKIREEIVATGPLATRVLIDFLLSIVKSTENPEAA